MLSMRMVKHLKKCLWTSSFYLAQISAFQRFYNPLNRMIFLKQRHHLPSFKVTYKRHDDSQKDEAKVYTYIELPIQYGAGQEFQKLTTTTSMNHSIKTTFEHKAQCIVSAHAQQSLSASSMQATRAEQQLSNQLLQGAQINQSQSKGASSSQNSLNHDQAVHNQSLLSQNTNTDTTQHSLQSATNAQDAQVSNDMSMNTHSTVDHETYGVRSDNSTHVMNQDQTMRHQKHRRYL